MRTQRQEDASKADDTIQRRENWVMVPFDQITVPKVEQTGPVGNNEFLYVDISSVDNKLKRIADPKVLKVTAAPSRAKQRLKSGDVLVSMTRPNLNAVALVPQDLDGAVGSTGFHVLRADDSTEPRWLYYAVQTRHFVSAMSELVQGALYPAVRPKDIRAFEIPNPPIDQQKQIVAEIEKQFSRLDEAVSNLKRIKANFKRYKTAVLKAAVEGRLVETEAELARREGRSYETGAQLLQRILETRRSQWKGKGKYKEPAAPDTTDLPELPEGWVWVAAEQVCDPIASGSTPKAGDMYSEQSEVPFIKVYNLTFDGSLDFTVKPTYIKRETHEGLLNRSRVFPGDVLTNIVGPPLGKVSIAPGKYPEWNINQAIVTFRATHAIENRLLAFWLMSSPVLGRLERTAKATAGQFNLQVTTCRTLAMPLPPKSEQVRIISEIDRRLSILRETESQVDANLQRAARLRHSILSSAFSGELGGVISPALQQVTRATSEFLASSN